MFVLVESCLKILSLFNIPSDTLRVMSQKKKLSYKHIQGIRENLINIALVVGAIAAFPVLISSLIRLTTQNLFYLWLPHAGIYLLFLSVVLLRKRLHYNIRTGVMIFGMFSLAIIDLFESGFSGPGFIWLMSSSIITSIFSDFRRTIIMLALSVTAIIIFFVLYSNGIIENITDIKANPNLLNRVVTKTLIIILIVSIISFSLRYIHKNLIHTIDTLNIQKENLNQIASTLSKEVESRKSYEEQLVNSERNFRNIFEQSTEAIVIANNQGDIIDYNEAFTKLAGIDNTYASEKDKTAILPSELMNNFKRNWNKIESEGCSNNISYKQDNGILRYLDCTRSIITYNNERAIMLLIRDNTEKINLEKASYLMAINAEEKERSSFSKELHDGLGPLLSTLKIYLEMYYSSPDDPEIKKRINDTLAESITSVKEISNNLSPYILENLGLTKAVESFVDKLKYSKKIDINFSSDITERCKPEIEIAFFRIITELINNTLKHSHATTIDITLTQETEKIYLKYADNGEGFDFHEVQKRKNGIGLLNLKSRIEKLGGNTEIITSPGNGFKMNVYLVTY